MNKFYIILIPFVVFCKPLFAQMAPNYLHVSNQRLLAGEMKFDIIGAASLFDGVSSGSDESQGKGSTGIAFAKEGFFQGNLIFSLGNNKQIDFTNESFKGEALLIPGNGSRSMQFDYRRIVKNKNFGYNASIVAAIVDWKKDKLTYRSNPLALKLQGSYRMFSNDADAKTRVSATADFGLSYRGYIGDASTDDVFKESLFATTKTGFLGAELNTDLWVNDTHFFFSLPYLGGEVKGLSKGQITLGVAISGKMISLND